MSLLAAIAIALLAGGLAGGLLGYLLAPSEKPWNVTVPTTPRRDADIPVINDLAEVLNRHSRYQIPLDVSTRAANAALAELERWGGWR